MDFVLHNLRLKELIAIVQENRRFYEDFVAFLQEHVLVNDMVRVLQNWVGGAGEALWGRLFSRREQYYVVLS